MPLCLAHKCVRFRLSRHQKQACTEARPRKFPRRPDIAAAARCHVCKQSALQLVLTANSEIGTVMGLSEDCQNFTLK